MSQTWTKDAVDRHNAQVLAGRLKNEASANALPPAASDDMPTCPKTPKLVATPQIASQSEVLSEKRLQIQLCQLLSLKDVTALTPRFGKKTRMNTGWPDMTFAWRGKPCVWEVKVGTNTLTDEQVAMLDKLKREGWFVAEIRSMEQAFEFLKEV